MIAESEQVSGNPASGGALAALMFMVFILAILVFFIGGLAHFGFGVGGAVQMLRGKDFNYPFIGRWVVNRLEADKKIEDSKEHIEDEENKNTL